MSKEWGRYRSSDRRSFRVLRHRIDHLGLGGGDGRRELHLWSRAPAYEKIKGLTFGTATGRRQPQTRESWDWPGPWPGRRALLHRRGLRLLPRARQPEGSGETPRRLREVYREMPFPGGVPACPHRQGGLHNATIHSAVSVVPGRFVGHGVPDDRHRASRRMRRRRRRPPPEPATSAFPPRPGWAISSCSARKSRSRWRWPSATASSRRSPISRGRRWPAKAPVAEGKIVFAPVPQPLLSGQLAAKSEGAVKVNNLLRRGGAGGPHEDGRRPLRTVTHFNKTMSTDLVPVLAKAGIANVRDGMDCGHMSSRSPASSTSRFAETTSWTTWATLQKQQVTPLAVMAFGNLQHFDVAKNVLLSPPRHARPSSTRATPATAGNPQAVRPAAEGPGDLERLQTGRFIPKAPRPRIGPKHYTAMLREAYTAVKAVHPNIQVVGGRMGQIPLPYSEKLPEQGALKYMDGIAVHPYEPTPEFADHDIRQLVDLMKQYNDGWRSQFGSPSAEPGTTPSAAAHRAGHLPRPDVHRAAGQARGREGLLVPRPRLAGIQDDGARPRR